MHDEVEFHRIREAGRHVVVTRPGLLSPSLDAIVIVSEKKGSVGGAG